MQLTKRCISFLLWTVSLCFLLFKLNNLSRWWGASNLLNNIQASKKCAIFVPPHEIKWIGVISRKPMQSFVFHATFKMRGNISQTVVKCHNLICKHHLGSCSSFQGSMCWVGSTAESCKTKKQRCFLFAVLFNSIFCLF